MSELKGLRSSSGLNQKNRKVKTGCRTCKSRKVKCDETRPSCNRCVSTGRSCEGYGIWGGGGEAADPKDLLNHPMLAQRLQNQSNYMTLQSAVLDHLPLHILAAEEHLYMEWFITRTIMKLPGAFDLDFWAVLLPQASLSEPAVLHAVLSLGSVHKRQALHQELLPVQGTKPELFTLQQYTRAIYDLRQRMQDRSRLSIEVALIACALFVQLEYLRGFYQAGLTHLRHGLTLLESTTEIIHEPAGSTRSTVNESIVQIFCTMVVQANLCGQNILPVNIFSLTDKELMPTDVAFKSLYHARQSLEGIFLRILSRRSTGKECSLPNEDACIDIGLQKWLLSYEQEMAIHGKGAPSPSAIALHRFAWKLLLLYHTLATVMGGNISFSTPPISSLSVHSSQSLTSDAGSTAILDCEQINGFAPLDEDTDAVWSKNIYQSLIRQCEVLFKMVASPAVRAARMNQCDKPEQDSSQAIADIGWIPVLYYTATQCRDRQIRLKAIEMLRDIPHREGIWDSLLAATIAAKVLSLEERGQLAEENTLSTTYKANVAYSLGLEDRGLADIQIQLPEGPSGQLLLHYSRSQTGSNDRIYERHKYSLESGRWLTM